MSLSLPVFDWHVRFFSFSGCLPFWHSISCFPHQGCLQGGWRERFGQTVRVWYSHALIGESKKRQIRWERESVSLSQIERRRLKLQYNRQHTHIVSFYKCVCVCVRRQIWVWLWARCLCRTNRWIMPQVRVSLSSLCVFNSATCVSRVFKRWMSIQNSLIRGAFSVFLCYCYGVAARTLFFVFWIKITFKSSFAAELMHLSFT